MKNIAQFPKDLTRHSRELSEYIKHKAPRIVGIEGKKHFQSSFERGGFTDAYFVPWKKSKRQNPSSLWYGFSRRAKSQLPAGHPRRWAAKRPYKKRKTSPITNFSPAATRRTTLVGEARNLADSIKYRVSTAKTTFSSNLPYAKIHNEGGTIKVFGRKTARLPQRKFMGASIKLNAIVKQKFNRDIKRIMEN